MGVCAAGVFTFVVILVLQVCGESHQVPAGPGADQRDGGTMSTLWTFLPLTHVRQLHDLTTEEAGDQEDASPENMVTGEEDVVFLTNF